MQSRAVIPKCEQCFTRRHQNLAVVPMLFGLRDGLVSIIAPAQLRVRACHLGIDERIIRLQAESCFQGDDALLIAVHAVQRVRHGQMRLNIIGGEFQCSPIFHFCFM